MLRWASWLGVVVVAGCAAQPTTATTTVTTVTSSATSVTTTSSAAPLPETPAALAAAIRQWEAVAGDHFTESARALEQVSQATDAEDEASVRSACQRLHDTNSTGLQRHLPTPDPKLTTELQRMIDDMNTATHACLRFTDSREEAEATTYQTYLARAVEHLQRAKTILNEDLRG